jgi:hypothetical protein
MVLHDGGAPWSELSDAELLAASRREPEAFGTFYERHARVVLAFFYRRTTYAHLARRLGTTRMHGPVPGRPGSHLETR